MSIITQFETNKDNLDETRLTESALPALKPGEASERVNRFALTANNVTYGVVGERIGYWKFFPTDNATFGVIPVWGVGEVIDANDTELAAGERLYGYWPMASHLVVKPAKVSDVRLFDGAEHRAGLPPVYNAYQRLNAEADYDAAMDDERMVLFPLYATSYCLYDFLKDNDWFGASQVIVPSASSKTAIGTAYAVKSDGAPPRLVGLTSPRNKAAVEALSLCDDVLTYDEIEKVDAKTPAVIVDMSGDGMVLSALHKHLGDNMKYTSNVGVTHYDANKMGPDFIAERSQMFFAPGHIQKRTKDWGPGEFENRAKAFWHDMAVKSRAWLTIKQGAGPAAVETAWRDVLEGKTPANEAWVVGF